MWQFDDCWPGLSWSVVDYYGFPKPSYYYLNRAYAPLLASFKHAPGADLELWMTNDRRSAATDRITVRLGSFDGRTLWEETCEVVVPAVESMCVWRRLSPELAAGAETYVAVRSAHGLFPANRWFFGELKELVRRPTAPEMTFSPVSPHEARLQLRAPATSYVYFAHVTSPHESTRFSDNYVDLQPGETCEIAVTDPLHELTADSLRLGWG